MFVERGLDGPFFVAQDSTSALQRNCKPENFGVDDAQIDRAIRSLEEGHRIKDIEQHFWLKFKVHYATSVAAMILCFNINIFTDMAVFWSGYVAFALGLFLLGHYTGVRFAPAFVEITLERCRNLARYYYEDQYMDDKNIVLNVWDISGLLESDGLLSSAGNILKIACQTNDSVLGIFKT